MNKTGKKMSSLLCKMVLCLFLAKMGFLKKIFIGHRLKFKNVYEMLQQQS